MIKADFCAIFQHGQCSFTEPWPTPSPWSIHTFFLQPGPTLVPGLLFFVFQIPFQAFLSHYFQGTQEADFRYTSLWNDSTSTGRSMPQIPTIQNPLPMKVIDFGHVKWMIMASQSHIVIIMNFKISIKGSIEGEILWRSFFASIIK